MKTIKIVGLVVFLFFVLFFAETRAEPIGSGEINRMRVEFKKTVGEGLSLTDEYLASATSQMVRLLAEVGVAGESQFFVYVDRHPRKQLILVCFYDSVSRSVELIGADKTSTGNPRRTGFFITPLGAYKNSIDAMSYRALGTKNEEGWRGLGVKGSRVWDFGWQRTASKKNEARFIRLLLHATDPQFGEPRLGQPDSKGCVRISGRLNGFLDHFGLLDRDYEVHKDESAVAWLLKTDREPISHAGQYLLIGESDKER